MRFDNVQKVAQDWIDRESLNFSGGIYHEVSSGGNWELPNLIENDYSSAWLVIQEIVEIIKAGRDNWLDPGLSNKLLGLLGAGDFEDLFQAHAAELIDQVEEKVQKDPYFSEMVEAMWQGDLPDSIWSRILASTNRKSI